MTTSAAAVADDPGVSVSEEGALFPEGAPNS